MLLSDLDYVPPVPAMWHLWSLTPCTWVQPRAPALSYS